MPITCVSYTVKLSKATAATATLKILSSKMSGKLKSFVYPHRPASSFGPAETCSVHQPPQHAVLHEDKGPETLRWALVAPRESERRLCRARTRHGALLTAPALGPSHPSVSLHVLAHVASGGGEGRLSSGFSLSPLRNKTNVHEYLSPLSSDFPFFLLWKNNGFQQVSLTL